jgi:hypothetical protein
MRSTRRTGGWSVGAVVVLVGGLVLAGCGQNNHTLRWDTNNPSATRFTVLTAFASEAVRDNNTGLVWERETSGIFRDWHASIAYCLNVRVGGTVGWRLSVDSRRPANLSLPSPTESRIMRFEAFGRPVGGRVSPA